MSNKSPNSPENPEVNEGLDQGTENLKNISAEALEAATLDVLSEAETTATGEDVLSLEEQQGAEIAELKEKLLRAMAETENIRRRSQKDKEDALNYSVTKFARDMLNISDNLRRAISAVADEDRENEAVKTVLTGVEMTESELLSTLSKHKVQAIEAEGKKFDPNLHQAMFEIENPDVEPGTILQVMQPGYVISGRLLRPALVGVAKGGQKKETVHIDQNA